MFHYTYRKHVGLIQKISALICGITGALLLLISLYLLLFTEEPVESMVVLACLSPILIIEALFIHRMSQTFTHSKFALTDEGVVYANKKSSRLIPYADIQQLKCPTASYLGGWMLIESNQKPLRLMVTIENFAPMLLCLKQKMDHHQLSDRYKPEAFNKLFKTALYADHSYERLTTLWKPLLLIIGIGLISSFGFTIPNLGHLPFWLTLSLPISAITLPFFFFCVYEFILGKKLNVEIKKEPLSLHPRNESYERGLLRQLLRIGTFVYLCLLTVVFVLFV